MLSSMLRSLSPRSPSRGAASPPQSAAADSKSFIELGAAVQYSDVTDLVLLDGKGVSTIGVTPRSPMSPAALWRNHKASDTRTLIADRFARALPTRVIRDQAAVPFDNLTDKGAVRVHQLRLLTALVKFQQDLITGGMEARQAAEVSTLAFTPATWNCGDTQTLYNRINTCLISSNQRIVKACLDASERDDPPNDEAAWRLELETASGAITQRRRSLAPLPDAAATASSEASPPTRVDRKAVPAPDVVASRRGSGDDHKASRPPSDSGRATTSEARPAAGEPATLSSVNRSLFLEFSGAGTGAAAPPTAEIHPPPVASALATRGAHPALATGMRDWGRQLADEALYRGVPDASGRQASAQANTQAREQSATRARWHRNWLPALLGLHERVTRASGQPLSNRFRNELLRWPLSVRASLLLCSADSLQSMDPRGAGWAPRYRFHAELARALAAGECYTAQEQELQVRVLAAVKVQAQARKQVVPNFQSVVAAVRAIFTQASQGRASAYQGLPSFELRMDSLNRQQASYNPFTRTVLIGPRALHDQSPMPYVLRHVAAASMHFYNHRLIDALALNEPHADNTDWQIGSMLHALEQVPITAPALKNAGLQPEQANLLVLHTLPKQRELSFARAVSDAWESAKRGTLSRSLAPGGGRQGVGTIAQGPTSVIPARSLATESQALAPTAPTARASAPSTAARVVLEDTGEGIGN